jgi:uncharacterized protein
MCRPVTQINFSHMTKIGLLSDTHGHVPAAAFDFFAHCDQIWHAGDMGSLEVAQKLSAFKPFRAVYGNIDGTEIRTSFPEVDMFTIEKVKVLMTHIGGYPGRYERKIKEMIINEKPALFISGHSHILKVIYDPVYKLLHINPGAAGNSGLHRQITMTRFTISHDKISDLEIYDRSR